MRLDLGHEMAGLACSREGEAIEERGGTEMGQGQSCLHSTLQQGNCLNRYNS